MSSMLHVRVEEARGIKGAVRGPVRAPPLAVPRALLNAAISRSNALRHSQVLICPDTVTHTSSFTSERKR